MLEEQLEAGIAHPDEFTRQWQLLMLGSITAASTGDTDAALRARGLATLLLRREAPASGGDQA